MKQITQSYAERCRQWLAAGQSMSPSITVQTVADTIDKFSRQLEQLDDQQQALADDLLETLDILNDYLLSVTLQGQASPITDATQPLATQPLASASHRVSPLPCDAAPNTAEILFDPRPLQDYSEAPIAPLSAVEREAKLAELLQSGIVSRGFSGRKRN